MGGQQFTGGTNLQRGATIYKEGVGNNLHWGGQQFASASVAQQLQTNPALNLILDPGGSGHIARSCIRFRSIGKARRSRAPRRGSVAHRGCRYTATTHGVGNGERGARGGGIIMMLMMMIYGLPPTPATLRGWWWGGMPEAGPYWCCVQSKTKQPRRAILAHASILLLLRRHNNRCVLSCPRWKKRDELRVASEDKASR